MPGLSCRPCRAGGWPAVLKTCPNDALRTKLNAKWSRKSDTTGSREKWADVEEAILEVRSGRHFCCKVVGFEVVLSMDSWFFFQTTGKGAEKGAKRQMLTQAQATKNLDLEKWRLELVSDVAIRC